MEIQAIEKCINNGRREKVKKMGFFGDSGALGVEWMGLLAADALARGGACTNSVSRAGA